MDNRNRSAGQHDHHAEQHHAWLAKATEAYLERRQRLQDERKARREERAANKGERVHDYAPVSRRGLWRTTSYHNPARVAKLAKAGTLRPELLPGAPMGLTRAERRKYAATLAAQATTGPRAVTPLDS